MDPRTSRTDETGAEIHVEEREESSKDYGALLGTSEEEPIITRGYD